jgi:hypothetical protein
MPISYSIDADRGLIVEAWQGDVTAADLRGYWHGYLADPRVMALRRTLVDLRQARILFTGEELFDLVCDVVQPALAGRRWTTAILVARAVQLGVSKQYQVFAEAYSRDAIFDDYDKALRWLDQESNADQGSDQEADQGPGTADRNMRA